MGLKEKKINFYKYVSGIPIPCYSKFWVQFHTRSLEQHMHWFSFNDLSHCIGRTMQKYVVANPLVPTIWFI